MRLVPLGFALLACASGCADVLDLGRYDTSGTAGTTTGTGATGAATTGGTAGTSTGGTAGTSTGGSTTTTGGTAGTSTGGSTTTGGTGGSTLTTECTPLQAEACYSGLPETEGIGNCHAGIRTCDADGVWGSCEGEQPPVAEYCSDKLKDENCDHLAECTGQYRWAHRFGGPGIQLPTSIAVDKNGDVIVAGYADTTFEIDEQMLENTGSTDIVLIKLDRFGKVLWSKMIGDTMSQVPTPQVASAVAFDPQGNIIVAGRFEGSFSFGVTTLTATLGEDAFVAKLDPDGQEIWALPYGSTASDLAEALVIDALHDVYVVGAYQGALMIGNDTLPASIDGQYNLYVAKIDANGVPIWAKGFGGAGDQIANGVALNTDFVYVAGYAEGALSFDGVTLTVEGGGWDVALAKLTDAGDYVWQKRYSAPADQVTRGLARALDDGVFITAAARGDVDFGLGVTTGDASISAAFWKVNADGTTQWARRGGSDVTDQQPWGLASSGGYGVVAGSFQDTLNFNPPQPSFAMTALPGQTDRFFTKAGVGGALFVNNAFPNGKNGVTRLAIDDLGVIHFAGGLYGDTDFGGGVLTGVDADFGDIVVGQLAP